MEKQMTEEAVMPEKPRYIWNKEWVRPFESLWSITRNFSKVNGCFFNTLRAFRMLGINAPLHNKVPFFELDTCQLINTSLSPDDLGMILSALVSDPEVYTEQFREIRWILKNDRSFVTEKLQYCPECMKSEYHSPFHQISGVRTCVFHPGISLKTYSNDMWTLGYRKSWTKNHQNSTADRIAVKNISLRNRKKLFSEENTVLPFMWKDRTGHIYERYVPQHDTEISRIKVIDMASDDPNLDNPAGEFLIETEDERRSHLLFSYTLNDEMERAFSDSVREDICRIDEEFRIKYEKGKYIDVDFAAFFSSEFSRKMLSDYSLDEIQLKEFRIALGEPIHDDDRLAKLVIFIYMITGADWAHRIYQKEFRLKGSIEKSPPRNPKNHEISVLSYRWYLLYKKDLRLVYRLIEKHYEICFAEFLRITDGTGYINPKERKGFCTPVYLIEDRKDGVRNVYVYKKI